MDTQDATQPSSSPTFGRDGSFHVDEAVGSASISPSGRDIVLASPAGLHIIDLDNPWSPPRHLSHRQQWEVADVQWSPFAIRDHWIVSTSNRKALVWNLQMSTLKAPIEFILHGHTRAITDINFSALDPDLLATCSVDSFAHCWDLRNPSRPAISFADWSAGASQVKWNRQDLNYLASAHDRSLHIWDRRKGAVPVKTILAHATKIYGIDWNRVLANQILTCSLDHSIKVWDFSHNVDENPICTIKTPFPVWRARHTPFGSGILAMPQRGDFSLHLYDNRHNSHNKDRLIHKPVHSFHGHNGHVKEFLWRSQGSFDDGIDCRQFQLVSWSSGRDLLLHRVSDDLLERVGYHSGKTLDKRLKMTRKGAIYKTFHELPAVSRSSKSTIHGLDKSIQESVITDQRKPSIAVSGLRYGPMRKISEGSKRAVSWEKKKAKDPISWMRGVKIGESMHGDSGTFDLNSSSNAAPPWVIRESLGDEISHAGSKYKNVTFEHVDVLARKITFSLTGPWGADGEMAHVKISMEFPEDYPEFMAPSLTIEKTSSISDAALTRLSLEINAISDAYQEVGRGCLEALICYLLGESDIENTIAWIQGLHSAMTQSIERGVHDSSSDDDDEIMLNTAVAGQDSLQQIENNDIRPTQLLNSNVNVPLPRTCGAVWSAGGKLVSFFPAIEQSKLLSGSNDVSKTAGFSSTHKSPFDSFGFLGGASGRGNRRRGRTASASSESSARSSGDESSSSFTSSSSDDDAPSRTDVPGPGIMGSAIAGPGISRQWPSKLSAVRSLDQQSSIRTLVKDKREKVTTQTISIQSIDDLTSSRKVLAEEYMLFGDKSIVCEHNANIAKSHGLSSLAEIWNLVGLIVRNNVPLRSLPNSSIKYEDIDVLIIAKRAAVEIKRKDSGLDLAFDEPHEVVEPEYMSRVKWGGHPLGPTWLLPLLLNHYEDTADIQMLAMLVCVLGDHSDERITPNPKELFSSSMSATPTISLQYFDSEEAALSSNSKRAPLAKMDNNHQHNNKTAMSSALSDEVGSYKPTLERAWAPIDDRVETEDIATNLTEFTSHPTISRHGSKTSTQTNNQSYSSSPEDYIRRTQSILSTRLAASFSKPFSFITSASESPPSQARTPEFSISAPQNGPGWARSASFNENNLITRAESRSSLQYELDAESTDDTISDTTDDEDWEMACTLTNLDKFEEIRNESLLDQSSWIQHNAWLEAYAHLLHAWHLPMARAGVLKFCRSNSRSHAQHKIAHLLDDFDARGGIDNGNGGLKRRIYCSICHESINGLFESCFRCSHCAHEACMHTLDQILDDENDKDLGCPIGCGCRCDNDNEDDDDFDIVSIS